jgi:Leucine-rich repeat (LRR) protein
MPRSAAKYLLLIIAAATCSLFVLTARALQQLQPCTSCCLPHERDALLIFKHAIRRDPVGILASWQRDGHELDCCRWRGVRCSNQTGHVLKLELPNVLVEDGDEYGYDFANGLVGEISSSLLSLHYLQHLDLSMNNLEGSSGRIPEFLGSMNNLMYLNLSGILFSGIVPPQLGNLSKLQYLDLSSSLEAYSTDMSWLTRLHFLQYLDLSWVNLSTVSDWPRILNRIPSLKVIHLSYCSLTSANQSLPHLNFTNLEVLDLYKNYFEHPIRSSWFWNITSLKYLNLARCGLYGQFPIALEDMTSLQVLDFSSNSDPRERIMSANLKNLCNLEILNLEESLLYGDITELFENLPLCPSNKLKELHLAGNNLTGKLPSWMGQLTALVTLDLHGNNISGPLPAFIGQLTTLKTLDLYGNHMDGVITEEHFNSAKSLQYIDMSYNSLNIKISAEWKPPFRLSRGMFTCCQIGPLFPSWLQWQVDIVYLDISSTGIADTLPQWFSNTFSNLRELDLSNNQLSGSLPRNMDIMSLHYLDLSFNRLTGQIPPLPKNLTYLNISMNSFSGHLPTKLPNLYVFSVFSNRIIGHIPRCICEWEELQLLDLSNNYFEGEFPVCFANREFLTVINLHNNRFSGNFPSFVQNCTGLEILDLARNNFNGRLPIWIGNLKSLRFLRLSHNLFSGNIQIEMTNLECLQYVDIAHNGISGSLPRQLLNLTAMRHKNPTLPHFCVYAQLGKFYPSVILSTKGQELNFGSVLRIFQTNMMSIDLSSNYLSGEIPEEITKLEALVNLNLSRNYFSRNIPNSIGAMQSLESLDLSRNKLSGEIPASLSNLTFVGYMDLSYNNLTGRIPSGSQLDTLYSGNPSMYTGNIGLCGPPLQKNCLGNDTSKLGHTRINGSHGKYFFYLGVECGFIMGIWVVFCALLFKKGWRIAYFRQFDNVSNEVFAVVVVYLATLAGETT